MVLERSKDTKMNDLVRSKLSSNTHVNTPAPSNPTADSSEKLVFSSEPTPTAQTSIFDNASGSEDDEYDSLFKNL